MSVQWGPIPVDITSSGLLPPPGPPGSVLISDGASWEVVTINGDASLASDGDLTTLEFRRHFLLMGG